MTGNKGSCKWILGLFLMLVSAGLGITQRASAYDEELSKILPGEWTMTGYVSEDEDDTDMADLAFLILKADGQMSLRCLDRDLSDAYTCQGTWAFEYLSDAMDRLTLLFTSKDSPQAGETAYNTECVYEIYAESWVEDDTEHTYMIFAETEMNGISPFMELYGYDDLAFHREKGPNMRVANCKSYVSLRESRSQSAQRLAKVPLGTTVLAYPEMGDENGFIFCVYQDEYGYILADYLERIQ